MGCGAALAEICPGVFPPVMLDAEMLSVLGEIGSEMEQAVPAFDAAGNALADDEPVTRKSHLGGLLPGCFRGVNKARALTGLDLVTEFDRGFE